MEFKTVQTPIESFKTISIHTSPHSSESSYPDSVSKINYINTTGKLKAQDDKLYRAAGVAPILILPETLSSPKRVFVLLTSEIRKGSSHAELSFCGGKIEDEDLGKAMTTAYRELWEETGKLLSFEFLRRVCKRLQDPPVFWKSIGKFALFLHICNQDNRDDEELRQIDARFALSCSDLEFRTSTKTQELVWADLMQLFDIVRRQPYPFHSPTDEKSDRLPTYDGIKHTERGTHENVKHSIPLSPFLKEFLKDDLLFGFVTSIRTL